METYDLKISLPTITYYSSNLDIALIVVKSMFQMYSIMTFHVVSNCW